MADTRPLTFVAAGGFLLSLLWFRYLPAPFVGPALIAACFFIYALRRVSSGIGKAVLIGLATAAGVGAAAEAYWWRWWNSGPPNVSYPESYIAPDEDLGYALVRGAVQRFRRTDGAVVLYDVVVTIDSLGLRTSPPAGQPAPQQCVLFFGDSFTLGEGVPDSATSAYQVALRTAGRYHVYNFGVHGYGPNHLLAQLEGGRVARVLDCAPRYAIYQVIPAHVGRVVGKMGWKGPRYRLLPDHTVQRDGELKPDDPGDLSWLAYVGSQFEKSGLLRTLRARIQPADRQRFLAIVATAARRVEHDFRGAEFHVLLWIDGRARDAWMADSLRARGLRVHLVEEALPGYRTDRKAYQIPVDGHPNAMAHARIAEFVASSIVQEQ